MKLIIEKVGEDYWLTSQQREGGPQRALARSIPGSGATGEAAKFQALQDVANGLAEALDAEVEYR